MYIYIYKYPFPFLSLHGVRSAFFKQIVYIEWQCCEKNEFPVQTLESDGVEEASDVKGYFAWATTTLSTLSQNTSQKILFLSLEISVFRMEKASQTAIFFSLSF